MSKPGCGNRRKAKFDATVAQLKAGMDRALAGDESAVSAHETGVSGKEDPAETLVLPHAVAVTRQDGGKQPHPEEGPKRAGARGGRWILWTAVIAAVAMLFLALQG